MTAVDIIGAVLSSLIGYVLIATTVWILWPRTWPLRAFASIAWPAALYIVVLSKLYDAVERMNAASLNRLRRADWFDEYMKHPSKAGLRRRGRK